jgi:hypothetical protein
MHQQEEEATAIIAMWSYGNGNDYDAYYRTAWCIVIIVVYYDEDNDDALFVVVVVDDNDEDKATTIHWIHIVANEMQTARPREAITHKWRHKRVPCCQFWDRRWNHIRLHIRTSVRHL